MKQLVIRLGPKARGPVPLMGKGAPTRTITLGGTETIGPEFYEHYHFKSLLKKSMLEVVREEEPPPPKPKTSSSSLRRKSKKRNKVKDTAPPPVETKPDPEPVTKDGE